jgi:hypothetical protein
VLDSQAASADASHVADDLAALEATGSYGHHTTRVTFAEGRLRTADRTLRVARNGSVVQRRGVDALVFETGDRRVAYLAGAVVRGDPGSAWLRTEPPVTDSEGTDVLVVGAPTLGAGDAAVSGAGGATATLATNVTHERVDLGTGRFTVAVETATPRAFADYFRDRNATVSRRDFDGDGTPSVVARYPEVRRGYLVVHDLALEVS